MFEIDLNSQHKRLLEIVGKALGVSAQLWADNPLNGSPNFSLLHSAALDGPYGEILKKFNEAMVLFAIIEHYHIAIIDKMEEKKKLLEELADGEQASDNEESKDNRGKAPTKTQEELREEHSALVAENQNLTQVKSNLSTELGVVLLRHIKETESFISTAKIEIFKEAEKLGYKFNDKEKAILETPVLRSDLEKRLKESYQKAQEAELAEKAKSAESIFLIPEAPAPPKTEIHRDFPKTEDFASHSLADLELRTLMALNAYWNRQVNEMIEPPNHPESNHHNGIPPRSVNEALKLSREAQNPPQESSALQKLRQEFNAKYEQDKKVAETAQDGQKRRALTRSRRDSRIIYNVGDSVGLLKEFNQTFTSLDDRFKKLNDLHKGETEEIYSKMRQLIDSEKSNKKETKQTPQLSRGLSNN